MAVKCILVIETCVCVALLVSFAVVKNRLAGADDSLRRLTAELERVQKARLDAVAEADFLRGAMRRLDASVKAANEAMDKAEARYYDRQNSIESAPVEWRTDVLPAGVCDAFAGYVLPAAAACSDSFDAAVPAAGD